MTASSSSARPRRRARDARGMASMLAAEAGDDRIVAAIDVMEEVMATRETRMAWLLGFLAGSGVAGDDSPTR